MKIKKKTINKGNFFKKEKLMIHTLVMLNTYHKKIILYVKIPLHVLIFKIKLL